MTRRVNHRYPATRKPMVFPPRTCGACRESYPPTGPRQVNCKNCGHPSGRRAKMIKRLMRG